MVVVCAQKRERVTTGSRPAVTMDDDGLRRRVREARANVLVASSLLI